MRKPVDIGIDSSQKVSRKSTSQSSTNQNWTTLTMMTKMHSHILGYTQCYITWSWPTNSSHYTSTMHQYRHWIRARCDDTIRAQIYCFHKKYVYDYEKLTPNCRFGRCPSDSAEKRRLSDIQAIAPMRSYIYGIHFIAGFFASGPNALFTVQVTNPGEKHHGERQGFTDVPARKPLLGIPFYGYMECDDINVNFTLPDTGQNSTYDVSTVLASGKLHARDSTSFHSLLL